MNSKKSNNLDTEATTKQLINTSVTKKDNVGADGILTISTAELTKSCNIIEIDENQLKRQVNKKVVDFTGNSTKHNHQQVPEQHQRFATYLSFSTLTPSSTATVAQRKFCSICNITKWLSFQENFADVHHRKGRRLHGLQFPLHPLQLFGWLMLILFGLVTYLLLIPSFTIQIQGPLYGLITGLYIVHIISHLTALLIDPADKELCRIHRNDRIVPEFDRTKHTHVIENGRCHLCNIKTSSQRTKHCSVCNKCVGKFDHHCKWLNHCIGARNYVAFLMCVISAVIATIIIVAITITQIVVYYVQPALLNCYWCSSSAESTVPETDLNFNLVINKSKSIFIESSFIDVAVGARNDSLLLLEIKNTTTSFLDDNYTLLLNNETTSGSFAINADTPTSITPVTVGTVEILNRISINDAIFIVFFGIIGLIAAIAAGLLLHLCFFHIYISFLGLTTYEYIRNHRKSEENKSENFKNSCQKSKNLNTNNSTILPKTDTVHFSSNPSKKNNKEYVQIFCCSGTQHPNALNPNDQHDRFQAEPKQSDLKFHCCANSLEYHQQRSTKAYYICSLLQEQSSNAVGLRGITQLNDNRINNREVDFHQTFHCCSSYSAISALRRVSAINTKFDLMGRDSELTVSTIINTNRTKSYLKYTEECTFCTFHMRSSRINSTGKLSSQTSTLLNNSNQNQMNDTKPTSSDRKIGADFYQDCCMKSFQKSQCWRRKWNCCLGLLDSPHVPNDIVGAKGDEKTNGNDNKLPVFSIDKINYATEDNANDGSVSNKKLHTCRSRSWSTTKFRHVMRMINRFKQPRCRYPHNIAGFVVTDHLKQNQIRPLQLEIHAYGCQQQQNLNFCETTSQETTLMITDPESGTSNKKNFTSNVILSPTSVIRDGTVMMNATSNINILPPALPPPIRRKIPISTNLMEASETFELASNSLNGTNGSTTTYFQRRFPAINNVYKRQRRKQLLRVHSPTLSPIHESGLSNPTSPQICRQKLSTAVVPNNFSCKPLQKSYSSIHSANSD